MTTDQRTPELTAMEAAQLDSFEAAAYAEEALRERMARAIWTDGLPPSGYGRVPWEDVSDSTRHDYRRMADAALAVVRTPVEAER